MAKDEERFKLIAQNKKAYHDYFIEESYEAGIVLVGTEVKSIRAGSANIKESFIRIDDGEAFIYNMNINPYEHGNIFNGDPTRKRKLLLHKKQINELRSGVMRDGMTIMPLRVYIKGSLIKMQIGLAKGKKLHDKRHDIAKKDAQRQIQRNFKENNRQ
ncbi:MAG TPA: SsrA-binding protein SmpB [Epulopiscium sp.]|nr:SsrA-binding protein SmpB [Candidatus Epulonipiscium sp.]